MQIKTSELTGAALDWAVATIIEPECTTSDFLAFRDSADGNYRCSTDWSQAGPIIERERIDITFMDGDEVDAWHVSGAHGRDESPLVAAMRCYVRTKLGDEVEIPEELQ